MKLSVKSDDKSAHLVNDVLVHSSVDNFNFNLEPIVILRIVYTFREAKILLRHSQLFVHKICPLADVNVALRFVTVLECHLNDGYS